MSNAILECERLLVRHQWVREQGTPRISVLVGDVRSSRRVWRGWTKASGRPDREASLVEEPARADERWLDRVVERELEDATRTPRLALGVATRTATYARWRSSRDDRVSALIDEGVVVVPTEIGESRRRGPSKRRLDRARSLAELMLFEALEATPSTKGRFQLNETLSVHFGSRALEVDLLSRRDAIALEVDGYHHFGDVEAYRRDRRKDLLVQTQGYLVLRFLAEDVLADPRGAVASVVEVLGRRASPPRSDSR